MFLCLHASQQRQDVSSLTMTVKGAAQEPWGSLASPGFPTAADSHCLQKHTNTQNNKEWFFPRALTPQLRTVNKDHFTWSICPNGSLYLLTFTCFRLPLLCTVSWCVLFSLNPRLDYLTDFPLILVGHSLMKSYALVTISSRPGLDSGL